MVRISRRQFVEGAAAASAIGLAGCTGGGGGDDNDTDTDGGADGDAGDNATDDAAGGNETDDAADGNATDGGTGGALSPEDYPAVDEWLTESEVGGPDETYDGTIEDARDSDTVTVDVGAQGNGGAYAFAPSAVAISTGTTVEWNWTGEGGLHNVVAAPDQQIGESDFEFSSGEPVDDSGVQYTRTFEQAGVALYYCEPHLSLGMKGAIVVE